MLEQLCCWCSCFSCAFSVKISVDFSCLFFVLKRVENTVLLLQLPGSCFCEFFVTVLQSSMDWRVILDDWRGRVFLSWFELPFFSCWSRLKTSCCCWSCLTGVFWVAVELLFSCWSELKISCCYWSCCWVALRLMYNYQQRGEVDGFLMTGSNVVMKCFFPQYSNNLLLDRDVNRIKMITFRTLKHRKRNKIISIYQNNIFVLLNIVLKLRMFKDRNKSYYQYR